MDSDEILQNIREWMFDKYKENGWEQIPAQIILWELSHLLDELPLPKYPNLSRR